MSYIKFAFFFFYIYLKSSWLERLPWFFKANIVPTWLHISNHTLVIKCVIKSWRLHNWAYDVPRRSGSSFTTSVSAAVKRRVPSGHDGLEKVHNVLKQSRGKKKKNLIGVGSGMKVEGQVPKSWGSIKQAITFYCGHRLRNRRPFLASVTLTPIYTRPPACWIFHTLMPPSACVFYMLQ